MIRPQLRAFIAGNASRVVWNAAVRFSAMTASHRSTGKSSTFATCWMPALLTSTSMPPCAAQRCISVSISATRVRSPPSNSTRTPYSSAMPARSRSMSAASPNPFRTMSLPREASARAMPSPMPLVEPVTSASLP
jgi:hypothetical protein